MTNIMETIAPLARTSTPSSVEKENEKDHVTFKEAAYAVDPEKKSTYGSEEDDEHVEVIRKDYEVATQVITTDDDPTLPVFTFRLVVLGFGLSAFGAVLGTIYTFKPQNASVSQLFVLIIAYVFGTAMEKIIPSTGFWNYLNPGPFNIKEHTCIVIMASTASNVSVTMEIIAALNLFYGISLNGAIAMFQIFSTQMIGYGIAGLLRTFLVFPT
ncbi:hypothetical protein M422DRAFT_261422 [Sphaerobolus stellatus SS14]|uniref:Oligopeptide transporter n=1 Tax=Sphaerobolus stellatus (strain SS14) TaxID=990650 RepID=A0A0C9U0J2_SPHS4|nr:hypothetical protein M422DRAFT_261422 [Sphaerobolus stellatus SS14]